MRFNGRWCAAQCPGINTMVVGPQITSVPSRTNHLMGVKTPPFWRLPDEMTWGSWPPSPCLCPIPHAAPIGLWRRHSPTWNHAAAPWHTHHSFRAASRCPPSPPIIYSFTQVRPATAASPAPAASCSDSARGRFFSASVAVVVLLHLDTLSVLVLHSPSLVDD